MKTFDKAYKNHHFSFRNILIFLFIAAVFTACQTGSNRVYGELGTGSGKVPFMEKARTGVLPSGLRYYILENSMPQGRAFLTLAVDAGSVLEAEDERGLAHFVEHMAFNGTERFPEAELINYLRSLGMRFGPEVNAYTSYDETVYGIEVPVESEGRRIPDTALAVIDDWTRAITFAPSDVDDERHVILEEHRSRLGAGERMLRQMIPLLFKGSPYAQRLPIGLPEVIENAPADRLEGFYRKWYRPENMAIIFVGDFDAEYLEASLVRHFHITPSAGPFERPRYSLPGPVKGNFNALILTDPENTQTRVDLYFKRTAELPSDDLSGYRNDIISYLADTIISFRFDEAEYDPNSPFIYGGSGAARYGHGSRFYVLQAFAKAGKTTEVLNELLTLKESLSRYGFTEDEADMAKRSLLSYMEQMTAEKDRQSSNYYIRAFTRHFLQGETVPDIEWELEAVRTLLPNISLKEINRAVKNYFADDDLYVFVIAPDSEASALPTVDIIRQMASAIKKAKIDRPSPSVMRGELMDYAPAPGEIVFESVDAETGAVTLLLSNGMRLILRETANRNNEISLYAVARGGAMSVPEENYISASLAAEMLNASGLGPYSRPDLSKMLADKQVLFSIWTSDFIRGLQGYAARNDLGVLMEMIHLGFTQPRLDPDAVAILLEQMRTRLAQEAENPDAFFAREVNRTIYGNALFHSTEVSDLDRVSIDDALEFIVLSLNPSDYTLVFTGSLDIDEMKSFAMIYLASIPALDVSFDECVDVDFKRPSSVRKEINKGMEERSSVYIGWFINETYSEGLMAAASVLGEYLDIRLTEEIRESLGGVYSISPWVSISPLPHGELTGGIYFVCNPERAGELAAAAIAQVNEVALGRINTDTLAKSREALVKSHEESIQGNLYIAQSYANSAVIYNSPMNRMDRRPRLYQAVTREDIQHAASRLLQGSRVEIILYPENRN